MTSAEEIAARRALLRQTFGESYNRLCVILFEEDPIGINFGDNGDEYEPEADTILPRLPICATTLDVRAVVHSEFVRWFDVIDVGPVERYDRIAARIWDELAELWHAPRR